MLYLSSDAQIINDRHFLPSIQDEAAGLTDDMAIQLDLILDDHISVV
jgi:hypothetical protein